MEEMQKKEKIYNELCPTNNFQFEETYDYLKTLGKGGFGTVIHCRNKQNGEELAMKICDLECLKKRECVYLKNEIKILRENNHPNLNKLLSLDRAKSKLYIGLSYCNGKSLDKFLKNRNMKTKLSKNEIRHIMRQIVSGLKELVSRDIIHRDLSLNNLMLHYSSIKDKCKNDILKAQVIIIDFGFAKFKNDAQEFATHCGTIGFCDPNIEAAFGKIFDAKSFYSEKCDIWSLGIIFYYLMYFVHPFEIKYNKATKVLNSKENYSNIKKGKILIDKDISIFEMHLLCSHLQFESEERIHLTQILNHEYFNEDISLDEEKYKIKNSKFMQLKSKQVDDIGKLNAPIKERDDFFIFDLYQDKYTERVAKLFNCDLKAFYSIFSHFGKIKTNQDFFSTLSEFKFNDANNMIDVFQYATKTDVLENLNTMDILEDPEKDTDIFIDFFSKEYFDSHCSYVDNNNNNSNNNNKNFITNNSCSSKYKISNQVNTGFINKCPIIKY